MFASDEKTRADTMPPGIQTRPDWQPRIGLALGSGVARGWCHIGVLKALARHGIRPDIVAGTSIGSVVAGSWAAGKLDVLEAWARELNRLRILSFLDFRINSGGMIGGERLFRELDRNLGDVLIEDLPVPFAAIAADLVTGHEVWFSTGPVTRAMRASFSMPGVFRPVRIDNRWFIDGALVNPVPVSTCQALGAQLTIAVNLDADLLGKARKIDGDVPVAAGFDLFDSGDNRAARSARKSSLARRLFRREPNEPSMFGVMVSSLSIIQDRLARGRLAGNPPDVHIAPRVGHIGLFEFDRAEELIALGEDAVERAMPEIADAIAVYGLNRQISAHGQPDAGHTGRAATDKRS